MQPTAY